ncbi:MAG: MoaD family protein, partial [Verrucomicrobiales bacterium]|nr:MoaD family protein [Verrucomicrobiales bacterium]
RQACGMGMRFESFRRSREANRKFSFRILSIEVKSRFKIMAVKVRIPTPLRKLTNEQDLVEVQAATITEAIKELQIKFPGIQERLVDEKGEVRRFVNIYVNEEDIRFLQNQHTPLKDADEISIIPAIAGG